MQRLVTSLYLGLALGPSLVSSCKAPPLSLCVPSTLEERQMRCGVERQGVLAAGGALTQKAQPHLCPGLGSVSLQLPKRSRWLTNAWCCWPAPAQGPGLLGALSPWAPYYTWASPSTSVCVSCFQPGPATFSLPQCCSGSVLSTLLLLWSSCTQHGEGASILLHLEGSLQAQRWPELLTCIKPYVPYSGSQEQVLG